MSSTRMLSVVPASSILTHTWRNDPNVGSCGGTGQTVVVLADIGRYRVVELDVSGLAISRSTLDADASEGP
jgi:hypothetical protein